MSKYKQITKNIYPSSPEGEMQVHNVTKLVHFCEISPQKIVKVSRYIEKKAKKDMSRNKIKFVVIALKIYQELIKGCRKNLPLFAANVLNFIKTSLEASYPELKIQATETFIRFAEVLDESSQYPELEVLVNHFFTMCQYDQGDVGVKIRVREEGLRGIRAYMGILDMTDELDAFVTRHTDQDNRRPFVPIIMENVTFMTDLQNNVPNTVQALATEVLRDVFTRANISVTSLFRAILDFLDVQNRWIPNAFAMTCFKAIYSCLKAQHEQILMTLFLQHIDQNKPANIKKQVIVIMVELFRESTGHFMQILDCITRHLVASVEVASQDQRVRDYEDHIDLQATIINSVGILCKKVSSQNQKMEAFNFICDKLYNSKHFKPTGLSGVMSAVVECVLRITSELRVSNYDPDWITPISLNLLKEMPIHAQSEIRMLVHKVCQNLLLGGKSFESYLTSKGPLLDVNEKLLFLVGEVIRDTLVEQIKMKLNQPENYVVIFQTLNILLHLGQKKEFFLSFPVVFAMQKSASKWKKIPILYANTINTVIAAYFYASASLFNCPPLTLYVDEIITKRKEAGQVCTHVAITRAPYITMTLLQDKYKEELKKRVAVDYVLFDRERTTELICNTDSCTLRTEPRLKRILSKKIHRRTLNTLRPEHEMKEIAEDEAFSPSIVTSIPLPAPHSPDGAGKEGDAVPPKPIEILAPGGADIQPPVELAHLSFPELKVVADNEASPVISAAMFEDIHKRPYASTLQVCSKNAKDKLSAFASISKVLDFDATFNNEQQTPILDGAEIVPLSKADMYSPPLCTLDMDFVQDRYLFMI